MNKEHAQKRQLQNERSVEDSSAASNERCRLLENRLTQVRDRVNAGERALAKEDDRANEAKEESGRRNSHGEEDFRRKKDFRQKEKELKQRLTAVSVEQDRRRKVNCYRSSM